MMLGEVTFSITRQCHHKVTKLHVVLLVDILFNDWYIDLIYAQLNIHRFNKF